MPTESAFLFAGLLFLAAALGYVFARFGEEKEEPEPVSGQLSADYLKGLNYLLSEQPDRAVEVFTRMTELDDETLETHFALGSLFRRRGEVDRAIRVHQNLMARPNLSREQKDHAEVSLAEDYLSAGLLDRAEDLFLKLRQSPEHREKVLQKLVRLYEITKDWERAIEIHEQLEAIDPAVADSSPVVHFYCELAEEARAKRDYTRARQMLRKSKAGRKETVRSMLAGADLAHDTGDFRGALKLYERVAREDPALLIEVIPRMSTSCREAGLEKRFTGFLQGLLGKNSSAVRAIAMATIIEPDIDNAVALQCLEDFVTQDSTLSDLIDSSRLVNSSAEDRLRILGRVRQALRRIARAEPGYQCGECGYMSMLLQWQCPRCRTWESVRPSARLVLDSMSR